ETFVERSGGASEDWTASVRNLCRACSEGNPDARAHAHPFDERWKASRTIGLALELEQREVEPLVSRWLAGRDRSALHRLTCPPAEGPCSRSGASPRVRRGREERLQPRAYSRRWSFTPVKR